MGNKAFSLCVVANLTTIITTYIKELRPFMYSDIYAHVQALKTLL